MIPNRDDLTMFGAAGSGGGSASKSWELLFENESDSNKIHFEEDFRKYDEIMLVCQVWAGDNVFYASAIYTPDLLYDFIGTNKVVCVSNDATTNFFIVNSPTELTKLGGQKWYRVYAR